MRKGFAQLNIAGRSTALTADAAPLAPKEREVLINLPLKSYLDFRKRPSYMKERISKGSCQREERKASHKESDNLPLRDASSYFSL